MTGSDPGNPEDRETRINALLDGELDEASSAALKAAAEEDRVLARALVEAWQLQRRLDELHLQPAPASLRRKLKRIPLEHGNQRPAFGVPRWIPAMSLAGGLALTAALAAGLVLWQWPTPPAISPPDSWKPVDVPSASLPPQGVTQALPAFEPDPAQVEQTRRELRIAFHYLDKAGFRVGRRINEVLNDELSLPIKENLSRIIPYSGQSPKEKSV
jgi:anti-sigma factor RsiW